MRDGEGFSSAVAEAVAEAGQLPFAPIEQLSLLGDDAAQAVSEWRRRGRPAGARNKRTGEIRAWLLSRYAHPLEVLAATYSRPVDVLAAELGCTKADAAALQIKCAVELAPYIEGKMPVAIDLAVRSDISLVIPGLNAPIGSVEDVAKLLTIDAAPQDLQGEQNQGVGEA